MTARQRSTLAGIGLALLVGITGACSRTADAPATPAVAGQVHEFSGRMSVTGSRQILRLEDDRQAGTFRLGGTLLLEGAGRPNLGFRVDIIGFSDSTSGMSGRSVWTDDHGQRIFSELHAREGGPGKPVDAVITGGTGRYAGIAGEYRFSWQYMADGDDSTVGARVTDLRGQARRTPAQGEAR